MKLSNQRVSYIENGNRIYFDALPGGTCQSGTVQVKTVAEKYRCGTLLTLTLSGLRPNSLSKVYPFVISAEDCVGAKQYFSEGFTSVHIALEENFSRTSESFVAVCNGNSGLFARTVYPLKFNERTRFTVKEGKGEFEIECDIPETFTGNEITIKVFTATGDMKQALEAYNSLIPDYKHIRTVVGYNTWDYYFTDIDELNISENLAFIKSTPYLSENLKYFTVDDGWQTGWGEWYANRRFPEGTKGLADLISSYGLIPGIWTAPICVAATCSYAPRKIKGFVQSAFGDPVGAGGYLIIDPTHPDGRQFIRDLFARLYADGFRLFKVDYVSLLLQINRFHDPEAGSYDAVRTLFADIRSVVGDSIILGCSAPAGASCPEVDCGRTGIDIHNKWGHVTWAVEHSQYNYGYHRRLWVNDPDFLIVRGDETDIGDEIRNPRSSSEHAPGPGRWRWGKDFSLNEARTWAAYVMALGGNMNLSDRLVLLNGQGLDIIRKALTFRHEETAVPLNQFDEDRASVWQYRDRYYLFNFTDEEKTFTVDADYICRDLWTDSVFKPESNRITVTLAGHASAVLLKEKTL